MIALNLREVTVAASLRDVRFEVQKEIRHIRDQSVIVMASSGQQQCWARHKPPSQLECHGTQLEVGAVYLVTFGRICAIWIEGKWQEPNIHDGFWNQAALEKI